MDENSLETMLNDMVTKPEFIENTESLIRECMDLIFLRIKNMECEEHIKCVTTFATVTNLAYNLIKFSTGLNSDHHFLQLFKKDNERIMSQIFNDVEQNLKQKMN